LSSCTAAGSATSACCGERWHTGSVARASPVRAKAWQRQSPKSISRRRTHGQAAVPPLRGRQAIPYVHAPHLDAGSATACGATGRTSAPDHRVPVNIFGFVRAQRRSNNTIQNSSGFTGGIECISTIMQDFGLDLEEISLNGGGAAAPPQQGRKSEHELAFHSCSGIVICDDSCFKRSIVSNIFQSDDYSFSCQAVSDRVVPRPSLSIFGFRTGAAERIASIGFDLSKRSHPFARPSVFQETKLCASAADKWLAA